MQFRTVVSAIIFGLNRVEPDFCHVLALNDVNVRRFMHIGRVETELVAFDENRWHVSAYFFRNALNKSIGSGRNVVVLCSLAISRMVWR